MAKERFKSMITVYMFFERGDEVLLIRRANTGYADGMYSVPAGHHDGGQSLREAAVREAKEEVGLDVQVEDVEFALMLHRPFAVDGDRVDAYFKIKKWVGEPKNMEPEKCDDMRWCKYSELPENTVPKLLTVISALKDGKAYAELESG